MDEVAEKETREGSLINRAKVKRQLLIHAADHRKLFRIVDGVPEATGPRFTRVSGPTLDGIEAMVKLEIERIVRRAPSKGMTL